MLHSLTGESESLGVRNRADDSIGMTTLATRMEADEGLKIDRSEIENCPGYAPSFPVSWPAESALISVMASPMRAASRPTNPVRISS